MRKEFVYSVSHELKTPIALIRGYAEGLKININKDEENKDYYCDVIMDETIKMNKIVKQLLELSYLESGTVYLEREDFHIMELVGSFMKKNTMLIREKNIQVLVDSEEDILVNADYDRAEQVLFNYINNAVNHVDIKRIIRIRVEKIYNKARITVFNSGSHIPADSLEKIWMSFYKVDKARTREYGGTGLGLSIVRAIQEAHRNNCGVCNVENGVEFWFELDVVDENAVHGIVNTL
jgi:signal transduction histidine kinase